MTAGDGVSFVVPVHNGAPWIRATVAAILAQADGRPLEVILVDDGSTDESPVILPALALDDRVRVVSAAGRGAAAAINAGVRAAVHPIVCQVDQDVVVQPGWMHHLLADLAEPDVGAAQGYYVSAPDAALFGRAMNVDLEQRYAGIRGRDTDHVCTGNTAYRVDALRQVGLLDEELGYGYDNDVSYRLCDAGYRLTINREARAIHCWREGLVGYLVQQYGFGYGRLDLVAKHPHRATGDRVSPAPMMAHPLLMALAVLCGLLAAIGGLVGRPSPAIALAALVVVAGLAAERLAAGIAAARRFGDRTALTFPLLHLVRDLAWVAAIGVWLARRVVRRPFNPSHSMRPRAAYGLSRPASEPAPKRPSA